MSLERYRCYQGRASCDNPVSRSGETCQECEVNAAAADAMVHGLGVLYNGRRVDVRDLYNGENNND